MKTLYLHIGTPKTATSSLQKFCADNREQFLSHGYCFPASPLSDPFINDRRNAHFLFTPPKAEEESAESHKKRRKERINAGLAMISESFDSADNVILSDEALWNAVNYTPRRHLAVLHEDAKKKGYSIKIVVYLRRQDKFFISQWGSQVQHRGRAYGFAEYMEMMLSKYPLIGDYAATLDTLSEMFGKENIIVRRFEPAAWAGGTIYADFLDAVGIRTADGFVLPQADENVSMQGNYPYIKRLYNESADLDPLDNAFFYRAVEKASGEFGGRYRCSLLSAEEINSILNFYKESNDRVAREYLGLDGPLFSEEISDLPKYDPDNPYMTDDIIRAFSALTISQNRKRRKLKERVAAQNEQIKQQQEAIRSLEETVSRQKETLQTLQENADRQRRRMEQFIEKAHHPVRAVLGRGHKGKK